VQRRAYIAASLAACILVLLAASACGRRPAAGGAPVRVAALSPGLAASLVDLGYAHTIVARHAWDLALPGDVPVAGDTVGGGIDYERLLAINPTHVVVQFGSESAPLPERLMRLAAERNWVLMRFEPLALPEVWSAAQEMDRVLSSAGAVCEPAGRREQRAREWATAFVPDRTLAKAGRVLLLADLSPPTALGPGSWHDDVLRAIGGVPAIADTGRPRPWIVLDAEDLRVLAPDAIVLVRPRGKAAAPEPMTPAQLQEALKRSSGGRGIPAIDSARLAHIDDPLGHLPATTVTRVASEFRRHLREWSR